MKEFWIALGIVLMLLPVLYYLRIKVLEAEVLLVPIYGGIDSLYGKIYSEMIREGKEYDAVILEFDSPGGTLGGIVDVIEAVKELKKDNITVIAYIKDEAMSGAYWIASYCDYIFANNYSLLGNIGVTASYLNFAGLLRMLNITYIEIYNGSMKEIGSPFKEPEKEEIERLRRIVNELYKEFLRSVKENRNLTEEQLRIIATSDIFLGSEGKRLGLVDYIGGIEEIKEFLKEVLKKEEINIKYPSLKKFI